MPRYHRKKKFKKFISEPSSSKNTPVCRRMKMLLDLSDEKLPDFLHFEILLRADTKELIQNCSLVSKKWHTILAQKQFWIQKIEYDGHTTALPPLDLRQLPLDFRRIAQKRPFEKNLILPYPSELRRPTDSCNCMRSNQCSNKVLGGDPRWRYQKKNGFSHEIPPVMIHENGRFDQNYDFNQIDSCLATSNFWSSKEILIDLIQEGTHLFSRQKNDYTGVPKERIYKEKLDRICVWSSFDGENGCVLYIREIKPYVLDNLRPTITVSEYVSHRTDCASLYHMEAYLLPCKKSGKKNPFDPTTDILAKYETRQSFAQWEPQKWIKIVHSFREYPPGVRYVLFKSDGKDLQFWAGHFGSKMARPSVSVHYEFNNANGIENSQNKEIGSSSNEGSSENNLSKNESQEEGSLEDEFYNNDFVELHHNLFNDAPPDSVALFPRPHIRRRQLVYRVISRCSR